MENTSQERDKDKRPIKATASAMRAKVAENPPKKRTRERSAQPEATQLVQPEHHEVDPEPEHHEGEPAQAEHHEAEAEAMEEGDSDYYLMHDMEEKEEEEEEMEREGVAASVPIQRQTFVNPFEGQPKPKEFS
ncbi:hypothetical protein A2U01_0043429, partial [Trifolium medium]|nr:hypothetical protein [Trifolium medium]